MATKASEFNSYRGDSALAGSGGLGEQGTQQVISGIWKMADAINTSALALRDQEFRKNREEYAQKIKDRDAVASMIASDQLNTDKMDEETRNRIRDGVNSMRDEFISLAKKGPLSDEGYIGIKTKYSDLIRQANVAKTNYLAMEADEKENKNLYDDKGGSTTTKENRYDAEGKVIGQVSTTTKAENIRRTPENIQAFEKHKIMQKEKMKADPNHLYEPFVPITRVDQRVLYPEIGYDISEKEVGNGRIEVTKTPSFEKTAFYYIQKQLDPKFRESMDREYENILTLSAGESLIDETNKRIVEYNQNAPVDQKIPLINRDTNKSTMFATINYMSQLGDAGPKKTYRYADKNAEALYLAQQKSGIEISEYKKKAEIEATKQIQIENAKGGSSNGISSTALSEIYKQRADAINNDPSLIKDPAKKEEKLKALEKEVFVDLAAGIFANAEAKGQKPNNLPHEGGSSALGTFGIMKDSGYAKEAFEKSPLFINERRNFKTYNQYYNFLAKNAEEHDKNFTPKYLKYLQSKVGDRIDYQLVYNYGGNVGLQEYKKGNLDYIPENNNATLGQHLQRAFEGTDLVEPAKPSKPAKSKPKSSAPRRLRWNPKTKQNEPY